MGFYFVVGYVFIIGPYIFNQIPKEKRYVFAAPEVVEPSTSPSPQAEPKGGEPTTTGDPVLDTIYQVFGEVAEGAIEVARAESSLNPRAQSKISSAKGLFQIIDGTWKLFDCYGDPLDAYDNTVCAKKIYDYSMEKYGLGWSTKVGWADSYNMHLQD